jgi:hypothetical protein
MTDTRKTETIRRKTVNDYELATALRQLCRRVQKEASDNMKLPTTPTERIVAINTMHNVFDRLDEALDHFLKGDDHE